MFTDFLKETDGLCFIFQTQDCTLIMTTDW